MMGEYLTTKLSVPTSNRGRMRIKTPVARLLANLYYGFDKYHGCKTEGDREARDVTLERAFVLGAINQQHEMTDLGLKMLIKYADSRATSGICAGAKKSL